MSDRALPVRLRFRHLSGPREGEVDEVTLPAVLGSSPEAHVRAPGSSPRHALVFEREGEEGFRIRERDVIDALTQLPATVLATGGGAVLLPDNRERLAARGSAA